MNQAKFMLMKIVSWVCACICVCRSMAIIGRHNRSRLLAFFWTTCPIAVCSKIALLESQYLPNCRPYGSETIAYAAHELKMRVCLCGAAWTLRWAPIAVVISREGTVDADPSLEILHLSKKIIITTAEFQSSKDLPRYAGPDLQLWELGAQCMWGYINLATVKCSPLDFFIIRLYVFGSLHLQHFQVFWIRF